MGDDMVPMALRDAVRVLREDVEPNDIWRRRVLHALSAQAIVSQPERAWSLRPLVAIAAAIGFMAVGAGLTAIAIRRPAPSPASVAAPSVAHVRFTLDAPSATSVSIVGDFNGWTEGSLPMTRSADGQRWEIVVPLAPGRYAYSFVVDGRLARDPSAPQTAGDDFGSPSSVIMVRGS